MADPTTPGTPLPVFSLQCHRDLEMALQLLPSLLRRCRDPIELVVHDDGSLTPEDGDRLREALGPIRIVSREEADDLVIPRLAGKDKCLAYRKAHPFGMKLLDPALIAGGPFALCDGDILFLRDFRGLDRRSELDVDLSCMKDWASSYMFPFRERWFGAYRTPMADYVNAGLLYCTPKAFDLDYIEWYIGNPDFSYAERLAEQTVWGALAGRARTRYYDPEQVDFPALDPARSRDRVALHFISPLRHFLGDPGYMAKLEVAPAGGGGAAGVATLRARPAIRHNLAQYIITRGYRKLRPSYIRVIIDEQIARFVAEREARGVGT